MIIAFIGHIGTGKTIAMTYLVRMARNNPNRAVKIFRYLYGENCYFANVDYNLYANYTLKDLNYQKIENTLTAVFDIKTKDNIVLLDELWQSADSRETILLPNKFITGFFAQSRKWLGSNSHLFHSAQLLHTMDIRIRNLTPFLLMPHIIMYKNANTGKKKAIRESPQDLPHIIELRALTKSGYLGDYLPAGNYPINVESTLYTYNHEEYIPPMKDNTLMQYIDKYMPMIESGEIKTKKKLKAILKVNEGIGGSNLDTVCDYLL